MSCDYSASPPSFPSFFHPFFFAIMLQAVRCKRRTRRVFVYINSSRAPIAVPTLSNSLGLASGLVHLTATSILYVLISALTSTLEPTLVIMTDKGITLPRGTFLVANQIVALFKEIKSGYVGESQPWKKFQLKQPEEYGEIERLLLADTDDSLWGFVDDKIRYDFDADRNQVVVRMPTNLHKMFLKGVEISISFQLRSFASSTTLEESIAYFTQCILNTGCADIFFPPRTDSDTLQKSKNSPDITFTHKDAEWPGVIIEVLYSTKRKDLPKLVDRYILDSDGSVRALIGLDIEYQRLNQTKANSKEAVFSVWEPEIVQNNEGDLELVAVQKIKDQPFRDAQGNPVSSPDLSLRLSSFAPPELSQAIIDHDQLINISTKELCEYLHEAEEWIKSAGSRVKISLPAGTKKRYREATPPEVLSEEDKEKFCRLEDEASQKRDDEDPDWESETESQKRDDEDPDWEDETESTRKKRRVKPDWEGETEDPDWEDETESTRKKRRVKSDWEGETESTSD